jgi:hypothetical protein
VFGPLKRAGGLGGYAFCRPILSILMQDQCGRRAAIGRDLERLMSCDNRVEEISIGIGVYRDFF